MKKTCSEPLRILTLKLLLIGSLFVCPMAQAQNVPALFERPGGLVPDKDTAVKIAEAVLFPIYSEKDIRDQQPYRIELKDGRWIIKGTLTPSSPDNPVVGGTFYIVISQRDARVVEIGHGA